ncbi:histidine kinase [Bacillaceae bacterium IKA-2]|nr:histidine kinase [Bacillaceae bacterium IKA-2]
MKWIKQFTRVLTSYPIHLKIYGMVFAVIFLVTIISLFGVRISITETLSQQLDERIKSIASDVASKSSDLMLTNNIYALQKLVNDTINNNRDVEYVFIMNEQGRTIVHSYEKNNLSTELLHANNVDKDDLNSLVKFETDKGVIRDVAVPIVKGFGGTARVGLRSDSLDDALQNVTKQMFVTMLIVLMLSILIVLALTRAIILPITQLVDLTRKVAKGDFTPRIENFPNDEIGKLTHSFNSMLGNLEKARNEKEKYYKEILTRNRELTLLNSISANITTVAELRAVLEKFIGNLVSELSLNSAHIEIKIDNDYESFYHSKENCLVNFEKKYKQDDYCQCPNNKINVNNSIQLLVKGKDIGKIQICSANELDDYSVKILMSIGNQLSVTIENIQLWQEIKKKEKVRQMLLGKLITVQEEERKRIARELHDETSHSVSSILLGLKVLEDVTDPGQRQKQISYLRDLAHHTLEEVHELAWQLRPSILDKFGLKEAIERYTDEFKKKYPVEFDLILEGIDKERIRPEVETAIFRIVQESLTNILKYAKAKSVSVIIIKNSQMISVIIEDDGVGFQIEEVLNKDLSKYNLGIRGMQERVSLLGGTLEIESEIDEGTAVMVKIPFKNEGGELLDSENNASG